MKKYLITLAMVLTLGQTVGWAQNTKHTDPQELVDSTKQDSLEAFSDTTDVVDTTVVSARHRIGGYTFGSNSMDNVLEKFGLDEMMGMGMAFALLVIIIIFVIAPVFILAVLFFFIYKNRKQKMKLAEMAMKQGQPIPDQLLVDHKETDEELRQKGIRQTFLGVGLLAFFGYVGSTVGIGVGILVTIIGLGKLAIVKTNRRD
jgi:hypothetical protein